MDGGRIDASRPAADPLETRSPQPIGVAMATAENIDRDRIHPPEPIADDRGASILGPRNLPVEAANPDLLVSPHTDAGTVPNLKFPFAQSRNRVLTGGWAREVTTRELPIAKDLAGVDMRLKPGGIREL